MVFKKRVYRTRPPCAIFFHPAHPPIVSQSLTRNVRFAQVSPAYPSTMVFKKAFQQGRNERRCEAYSLWYVERLCDVRTQLDAFFNTIYARLRRRPAPPGHNNNSGLATKIDE